MAVRKIRDVLQENQVLLSDSEDTSMVMSSHGTERNTGVNTTNGRRGQGKARGGRGRGRGRCGGKQQDTGKKPHPTLLEMVTTPDMA